MRSVINAVLVIALLIAITAASLFGFIGFSVALEAWSICPDANQCADALTSFPIYLVLCAATCIGAFFIFRLIAGQAVQ